MKSQLKKFAPKGLKNFYHLVIAYLGAIIYRFPSRRMVIIGITGTKGKTTTANFIWSVLQHNGAKTGLIGTANIRIGKDEQLNKYHMTMPGRFVLQKTLAQMAQAGCKYVVMEVTSEGIIQSRHRGIDFDVAIFTNLTPEHLPSHGGSFENYKRAKNILFKSLRKAKTKVINGRKIAKIIIANSDSEHADYYLNNWANKKFTYSVNKKSDFQAEKIISLSSGVKFQVKNNDYRLKMLGEFNVYNALPAIILGRELDYTPREISVALEKLDNIPGRMEKIEAGQPFTVIVDYAHEKESMTVALNAVRAMRATSQNKIIVLLGAEGGGRDKNKRPQMGEVVAKLADYVVVSNVDPYEDDPEEILEDIAKACEKFGKKRSKDLFVIEDREAGIKKALKLAQNKDIVLITGKGAEQSITIGGEVLPWDDREVTRKILKELK